MLLPLKVFALATMVLLMPKVIHQQTATDADYSFETSAFMKKTFYHNAARLAVVGKDMAASGAWGTVNESYDSLHTGKWYIEEQRYAADAVCAGIAQNNKETINRAITAIKWGFKQQNADGSYTCPDNFHSTSFFVEAVAHSCLMLQKSQFANDYKSEVTSFKGKLLKSALWMIKPDIEAAGRQHNMPYTHRRYLVAAALGETGVLCNNQQLINKSENFIDEGLKLQNPVGYNPEKGGYDCSYNAVGLVYAHRYYDLVADNKYKDKILAMYAKSMQWLQTRIAADGTINPEGNTRTGLGQEKGRAGQIKTISYGSIAQDLYWWSTIKDDRYMAQFAEVVYASRKKA